jgi:transcriptional regulator with XRE-family HTH domain
MRIEQIEFEVSIPNLEGTEVAELVKVMIPVEWDEELKEWLLTPEAHRIIEDTKARRMGLLLPAQFKELRDRYGFSQKEMGELFQVGEKSWTRWESGKHRPSRSINLLIRALFEKELSINYLLKRAGKPPLEEAERVAKYFQPGNECWSNLPVISRCGLPGMTSGTEAEFHVPVQSSMASSATNGFLAQLMILAQNQPGQAEELFSLSQNRIARPAPNHSYPQPRLTGPTEA